MVSPYGTEALSEGDAIPGASRISRADSHSIALQQARHGREELCSALRALLMTPLMTSAHSEFAAVRRHADSLKEWFAREAGWTLHVERDCARLYKRPADLLDPTRGFPDYNRRRYVLFCLACAVLERADPQITLRVLGERLLQLAAEPALGSLGFTFTLQLHHERRELVAVCRSLLDLGVLMRVAGDEEGYVHHAVEGAEHLYDALYDVKHGCWQVYWRPYAAHPHGRRLKHRALLSNDCTRWSPSTLRTPTTGDGLRYAAICRAAC